MRSQLHYQNQILSKKEYLGKTINQLKSNKIKVTKTRKNFKKPVANCAIIVMT